MKPRFPLSWFPAARDWRPARSALSRRAVLRGFARGSAVAVALPPLQAMFNAGGTAYACDGVLPVRFLLWFWGNGNLPDQWIPTTTGDGDAWALSHQLAPLAAYKHKLCVPTGLDCKLDNTSPHGSGLAGILTAVPRIESGSDSVLGGPTIDQVIAQGIGGDTIYRSIQTAASNTSGESWNGPNSRNPAETDPYAFYARMFGDTFVEPGEDGEVDPRLGLRRSVLDAVMDDIDALNARVGAEDRLRLEQHLTGVRELELRLARLEEDPPDLESCSRPDEPTGDFGDIDGRAQVRLRNQVMSELIAMSFACDQTRVGAHFVTNPVSDVLFPDTTSGHHDLTHNEGGDQPQVDAITVQLMECFADTIGILDAIPEGDGTLLDNMVAFATSEVSLGQVHSIEDMPIVLAGSACGYFKQDHHYRSLSGENVTKLLISLQQAVGMSTVDFGGGAAAASGGLSDLEA